MKSDVYACDNCGKETKDYYAEKGWIVLTGRLTLTRGRRKSFSSTNDRHFCSNDHHFCSFDCLGKLLEAQK